MSLDNWKLENDLCRCCHAEGIFKNLGVRFYNELGEEEIYSDMIRDNLGIDLTPVEGLLCEVTFKICDQCVLRLRDVTCFKRQVQSCEEKFRDMYSRNVFKVVEPFSGEIKVEPEIDVMKIEENADDGFDARFSDEEDDKALIEQKIKNEELRKTRSKGKTKAKAKPKEHVKKERVAKQKKNCQVKKKESVAEDGNVPVKKKGEDDQKYYRLTKDSSGDVYKCNLCCRDFASQPLVSQHYRFVHLKKRPRERKCPKCDIKIPAYLKAYHLEEAHGIPAPTCGACGKKFRFPCHVLQHHKKVHMGERTVSCSVCHKSFFNNLSLKVHMSAHSNERRYKCHVCAREFRWENNLKDHLKIHTGDKKYVCSVCAKAFVQKSSLKQHVVRNHPSFS